MERSAIITIGMALRRLDSAQLLLREALESEDSKFTKTEEEYVRQMWLIVHKTQQWAKERSRKSGL